MERPDYRPARRSRTVGFVFACLIAVGVSRARAGGVPPEPVSDAEAGPATSSSQGMTWGRLLRELSQEIVPADYEVLRDWGDTAEVFSGFKVRTTGGRLRISKRTRRVNHGLWRRFRVHLLHRDDRLRIELRNVHLEETGGMAGRVVLTARLRCTADAVSWNYGVRGPGITIHTDLTLRAVMDWQIVLLNSAPDAWIPEYHLVPDVRRVRLRILDFDVRRIGPVGGDVALALGAASRQIVEELLKRQEPRVLRRLQRETGHVNSDPGARLSEQPPIRESDGAPCSGVPDARQGFPP